MKITSHQAALVIFCKRPKLNQGKQRLAAEIGTQNALELATHLLNCTLEDARNWNGDVILAISHRDDEEWAHELINEEIYSGKEWLVCIQPEGSLGRRINDIDTRLRALSYKNLIFIGTDSPSLSANHFEEVKQQLEHNDAVLSNADDGGVVIMANRKPWPDLESLPWSTDKLAQYLRSTCRSYDFKVTSSTGEFDVDRESDLQKLFEAIKTDFRPARKQLMQWLKNYFNSKVNRYYA